MGSGGRSYHERPVISRIPGMDLLVSAPVLRQCQRRSPLRSNDVQRTGPRQIRIDCVQHLCADFTRDIASKYVTRGLSLLFEHSLTVVLVPIAGLLLVSNPTAGSQPKFENAGCAWLKYRAFCSVESGCILLRAVLKNLTDPVCLRQLALANIVHTGVIQQTWAYARQTDVQLNLVRPSLALLTAKRQSCFHRDGAV